MKEINDFIKHLSKIEDTNSLQKNLSDLKEFGEYEGIIRDKKNWDDIAKTFIQFKYLYELIEHFINLLGIEFLVVCEKYKSDSINHAIDYYLTYYGQLRFIEKLDKSEWKKLPETLKNVVLNEILSNINNNSSKLSPKVILFRQMLKDASDTKFLKKIDEVINYYESKSNIFSQFGIDYMPKSMKDFNKRDKPINLNISLIWYGIFSMLLLLIFCTLQLLNSKILSLEAKWLFVSGVPILIGLLLNGIVKNFKGFGIEIETNLSEPIKVNNVDKVETISTASIDKGSISLLSEYSRGDLFKIEKLRLITDQRNYYDSYAVIEYIRRLPNLKFIEIANVNEEFKLLIPSNIFIKEKYNDEVRVDQEIIEKLLHSLNERNIEQYFHNAISDKINENSTIIEAYSKFQNTNQGYIDTDQILPVIDDNNKMKGICRKSQLEKKIVNEFLKTKK